MISSVSLVDDLHSLQVVMTYADDHVYRLRCLPWFLNKRYLNRHVFDGIWKVDRSVNEIYMGHSTTILTQGWPSSPREQLYLLFKTEGVDQTFEYLTDVARSGAANYFLHKDLYNVWYTSSLSSEVEKTIQELMDLIAMNQNVLSLDQIVSGLTYQLLHWQSTFLRKNF